jgi:hypothetical protein
MSRARPGPSCRELAWGVARGLSDAAQVALEDYARALLHAVSAEVRLDPKGRVDGVHVCGVEAEPSPEARRDVEAFAEDLAQRENGGGLGWS